MPVRVYKRVGPAGIIASKSGLRGVATGGGRYFRMSMPSHGSLMGTFRLPTSGLRYTTTGGASILRRFNLGDTGLLLGSRMAMLTRMMGPIQATFGTMGVSFGYKSRLLGSWIDWRLPWGGRLRGVVTKVTRIDRGWQQIKAMFSALNRRQLEVGFLKRGNHSKLYQEPGHNWTMGGKVKPRGTWAGAFGKVTIAQVAAWMEWGTKAKGRQYVPERKFFRTYIESIRNEVGKWFAVELKQRITMAKTKNGSSYRVGLMYGVKDVVAILKPIGERLEKGLANSIIFNSFQDNAPATIEKKGFNRPLVDTGQVASNIEHKIVKQGSVEVES